MGRDESFGALAHWRRKEGRKKDRTDRLGWVETKGGIGIWFTVFAVWGWSGLGWTGLDGFVLDGNDEGIVSVG